MYALRVIENMVKWNFLHNCFVCVIDNVVKWLVYIVACMWEDVIPFVVFFPLY